MLIRKLLRFEGAHIVRNCSTERCAFSIHGHSYQVEVLLQADRLDHGQMVYDFGLMKQEISHIVDAFDHTLVFWDGDTPDYVHFCRQYSRRWISLPVSPSAEQLSRVFFILIEHSLQQTPMKNGEGAIKLSSIIVHETATGYAQCFAEDAHNPQMGLIALSRVLLSPQVWQEAAVPFLEQAHD